MHTLRTKRRSAWLAAALALAVGCADPVGEGPQRVCAPGATQRCECPVGTSVQSCALDGTRWERCECGAADAGSQDVGDPGDVITTEDTGGDVTSSSDTSPSDAAAQDATTIDDVTDAAPDGATVDANVADAGSPDTGAFDAGATDVPRVDARVDAATDATMDVTRADVVAMDARPPTDAASDVRADVAVDVRMDAAPDVRVDSGVADTGATDVRPADVTGADAGGMCAPAAVGTVTTMVTTTSAFYANAWPVVAQAGGEVLVLGPFDRWRRWYRWSGSDWASEAIPWPSDVVDPTVTQVTPLVDRTMLVTFTHGTQRELAVYDGRAWTARVAVPTTVPLAAATRTPDGVFHLLTRELGGFAMRTAGPGGVGMAGPVPMPSTDQGYAMAALTNGRIVIAYIQRSLYVIHRAPGGDWVGPTDLTSSWAVTRSSPVIAAARSGGVLVGLTGVSTSYRFPHVFASPDGVRWNEGETLNRLLSDGLGSLDAECIENPVAILHGGYRVGPRVWRRAGGAWSQIDGPPPWPNGSSSVIVRPSGRAYWAWDQSNEAVTSFSVTMRGGRE